jgi:hypothetical protein
MAKTGDPDHRRIERMRFARQHLILSSILTGLLRHLSGCAGLIYSRRV